MKTKTLKGKIGRISARIILILYSIVVLFPLIWNVTTSFKTNKEILTDPWSFPASLQFGNYVKAVNQGHIGANFMNSIFVVIISLLILMVFSIPCAYALAKFKFKFSKSVLYIFIGCMFFQASMAIIPLFLLLSKLHLTNSLFGLCIVYGTSGIPFTVFLLVGFFKTMAKEYSEAAQIDGCSYLMILLKIIIPMSKPAILTAAIFNGFGFWNEYITALTLISSPEKYTVPIGLSNLFEQQRYATEWGALFAGLIIVMVPTLIAYCFAQSQLTKGINVGGIKG